MSQYRKDEDKASKDYKDTTRTNERGTPNQDSPMRRAGVNRTDGKPDEAVSAAQRNAELQRNPPPLVHVDPSTGKPIDRPFSSGSGSEPNQLTTPGAPDKPTIAGNKP